MDGLRLVAGAVLLAGWLSAWAGEVPKAPPPVGKEAAPGAAERIYKRLQTPLEAESKEHSLTEWLQLFAKVAQENFVLDPTLPKAVGETKVTVQVQKGGTVQDALAVALALTGLRYTLAEGMVFISTEGKLAERLLYGASPAEPMVAAAREPMTVGDAVTLSQPFDPRRERLFDARTIGNSENLFQEWEPPRYNPRTGLTDFPGPPLLFTRPPPLANERYQTVPVFLTPEALEEERLKKEFREERDRLDQRASTERLDALLRKMDELLKKLDQK